jgi:hypothetical protein
MKKIAKSGFFGAAPSMKCAEIESTLRAVGQLRQPEGR